MVSRESVGGTDGPLSGIKIVDLSSSYAGPTASMYLADLGAEVIKVERLVQGDDARAWGPPFVGGTSAWFASANRKKQSLAMNLRSPAAQLILNRIIPQVDVLIQSFNPSKLASLGLDPGDLRSRFPRLIHCAISGFGMTGPDSSLPGYDLVAQARSGLMSVTGERGRTPQRVSTALTDITASLVASVGICAALRRQAVSGQGEFIDVSLLDSALALMAPRIASFLAGEAEPEPSGGTDSVIAIYQAFETADTAIVLAIGNDQIWERLCTELGLFHLSDDHRLTDNAGRRANRDEIVKNIQARLTEKTSSEWLMFGLRSPWRLASQETFHSGTVPRVGTATVDILLRFGFSNDEIANELLAGTIGSAHGVGGAI